MPAPATVPPPQPVAGSSSQTGTSSGTTTTIKTTATPASTGTQTSSSVPQQQGPPSVSIGEGAPPPQAPPPVKPPANAASGAGIGSSAGTGAAPSAAAPANNSQPQNGQEPTGNGQEGTSANGGQDQGQAPSSQEGGAFVFRKQVEEVALHATVLDEKQRMVTNLPKTAFTVFENNQPQTISSFRHEDIPVAMGIVIDNSGSMREKRDNVNKAAINLVRASNPQDEVFVVNFNDEYYLDQDFTAAIPKLREALEKVESRGGTALYDAVVASADHLKKNAKLEKKVLFVVTDGEDNASRESLETAVRRLQAENGPTVYAIGLLGEEKQRRARNALKEMAVRTGGVAFFPKDLNEVDEISSTVAHDIRNQYTIGYKPTTPKSAGGYRAIRVEAHQKGYGKLTVRTRSGYYAGQEKGGGSQ
ncbi:MAG TPA: VWA domain-containing protein [Terriglobales bacterium]|nr:VWA domain-containing protein [Terriglobales bacterium]